MPRFTSERRNRSALRENAARIFGCVVGGHRWDVSPSRGARRIECVRCGMVAEPVSPRA